MCRDRLDRDWGVIPGRESVSKAVNDVDGWVTIDGELGDWEGRGMSRGELGMSRSSLRTLWRRGNGCETVRSVSG